MVEAMAADPVDTPSPADTVRWLRERAAVNRRYASIPPAQWEVNVLPHVAFRLDQAADMIERFVAAIERHNASVAKAGLPFWRITSEYGDA